MPLCASHKKHTHMSMLYIKGMFHPTKSASVAEPYLLNLYAQIYNLACSWTGIRTQTHWADDIEFCDSTLTTHRD